MSETHPNSRRTDRGIAPVIPGNLELSLLSGLEEASLYHDAGEYGFFSVLWPNNASVAANLARTAAEGRSVVKGATFCGECPRPSKI